MIQIDYDLQPSDLEAALDRTWQLSGQKISSIEQTCTPAKGTPVFTEEGIQAQQRWDEINGVNNTWFCGAYWRNGFHEDGVWSALRVSRMMKEAVKDQPSIDSSPFELAQAV